MHLCTNAFTFIYNLDEYPFHQLLALTNRIIGSQLFLSEKYNVLIVILYKINDVLFQYLVNMKVIYDIIKVRVNVGRIENGF